MKQPSDRTGAECLSSHRRSAGGPRQPNTADLGGVAAPRVLGPVSVAGRSVGVGTLRFRRESLPSVDMVKGPLSPRQIGRLARACLDNARRLIDDAELLLNHRCYASAGSCALFALEEFGKHMWCMTASSFDPDDSEAWRNFWRVWRTHPRKLAFGAGQLIDVEVNQLDVSDEKADEIWRVAYADQRRASLRSPAGGPARCTWTGERTK